MIYCSESGLRFLTDNDFPLWLTWEVIIDRWISVATHLFQYGSKKQFSGNFGNLLFLAGFNFQGHFEGLNEGFSRSRFSMIVEGIIDPPK
jgi:hypothetical protein